MLSTCTLKEKINVKWLLLCASQRKFIFYKLIASLESNNIIYCHMLNIKVMTSTISVFFLIVQDHYPLKIKLVVLYLNYWPFNQTVKCRLYLELSLMVFAAMWKRWNWIVGSALVNILFILNSKIERPNGFRKYKIILFKK